MNKACSIVTVVKRGIGVTKSGDNRVSHLHDLGYLVGKSDKDLVLASEINSSGEGVRVFTIPLNSIIRVSVINYSLGAFESAKLKVLKLGNINFVNYVKGLSDIPRVIERKIDVLLEVKT